MASGFGLFQVNVFHGDIRNYKKDLIKNMKKRNLL